MTNGSGVVAQSREQIKSDVEYEVYALSNKDGSMKTISGAIANLKKYSEDHKDIVEEALNERVTDLCNRHNGYKKDKEMMIRGVNNSKAGNHDKNLSLESINNEFGPKIENYANCLNDLVLHSKRIGLDLTEQVENSVGKLGRKFG